MWRTTRGINYPLSALKKQSPKNRLQQSKRWQSATSAGKKSGKGKLVFALVGGSAATVGGSLAYANYDPQFRTWLEDTVPVSKTLLDLLGDEDKPEKPTVAKQLLPSLPTRETIIHTTPGSGKKKTGKEDIQSKKSELSAPPSPPLTAPPPPPLSSSPHPDTTQQIQSTKKEEKAAAMKVSVPISEDAQLQERLTAQEIDTAAENAALEQILKETTLSMEASTQSAVTSHKEAQHLLKEYIECLQNSIDSPEESKEMWRHKINSSRVLKNDAVKQAEAKTTKALETIQKLKNIIHEGRHSKLTSTNPALTICEESISNAQYQVHSVKTETISSKSEATVVAEYRDLVEKARQDFHKEVQTLFPEVKLGEKGQKLSEEELNYLMAHAHRRVEQLQKQLAMQQVSERQRFKQALDKQKEEYEKTLGTRVSLETSKQQQQLEIDYHQKLAELRDEFEQELRTQLRRQAAAHSDHLQDVLRVQQQEIETQFEQELKAKVTDVRTEYESKLSKSFARLKGIEEAIKARAHLNEAAERSQALWLACQSLKQALKVGQPNAQSWEEQLKPLNSEIKAIKHITDTDDPFIKTVLQSVPDEALNRGVYTEAALKERFLKVHQLCRRLALIDETGGSLFRYALSYLQSVFIIDAFSRLSTHELSNSLIDPDNLTPYDVLSRARWCVERDDLEQALRYMNLLRGAPRLIAQEWMHEVRLLLETQQIADTLMALSAATGIRAYL